MSATVFWLAAIAAVIVGLFLLFRSWVESSGGAGLDPEDLELQDREQDWMGP